jgi:hypothetical protein
MRIASRNALGAILVALAAICLSEIAEADTITVIRGSNVRVVNFSEIDPWKQQHSIEPVSKRKPEAAPSAPAARAEISPVVFIIVNVQASPTTAWALVDPWKTRGIRVDRWTETRPSQARAAFGARVIPGARLRFGQASSARYSVVAFGQTSLRS